VSLNTDGTGVTATFADGSSASGSFLAGCDGANSGVREALVGKDKAQVEDLDINMFNVSCAYPAEVSKLLRSKHPCFKNSYHPDLGMMYWLSIMDVTDPDRPETWLHQNCVSWIGAPRAEDLPDQASRTEFLHEKAALFAEPWRSAGTKFPENLSFGIDRITVWDPSVDWSGSDLYGRVTLAGDSAHCMPPHRGQGLNNALQDAALLVEELDAANQGKKSLMEAVQAYEKDMKERTIKEIPISIAQARMVHSWETLMNAPFIKMGMNKQAEADALEKVKEETHNTAVAS
jgi:2-polyprenyl-6-methoxyphenol hydroxylase-like FAD-dependent oxidoreductase